MIIDDLYQQTPEWFEMRKGCCTGSRVADAVCLMKRQPKEGPPKYYEKREDYKNDIVVTRLTGRMPDRYVSKAMEWGTENEPLARAEYERVFEEIIEPVGLAFHPKMKWFCASPDGLIGKDGVFEAKCPNSGTHLEWMLAGVVPEEYIPQMKAEIVCSERKWCDFVSYDPRMPDDLQLFVRRFEPTQKDLMEFEMEVEKFLSEVDAMCEQVKEIFKKGALTCRGMFDVARAASAKTR